ncbi:Oidioi.mRNA.OKI2018_I69.YSR.g17042.t1.cds [Oikopleura dioica]|uniref:Oidioi.mRNA.OKI2018_I69.YSR.g17042.t1.cds n=1 Tax=Oikopleura dioica TaxID=34765 RepID=A0ABN7SN63_OIKDI|nr:Oidioi.mRNA.OKI2018_I69.YSR.g17042.t1.cds [Oikopleura dioica]
MAIQYARENNIFDEFQRAILLTDQAGDYKSQRVLSDISDVEGWGMPITKVFKQARHGKSTIDAVGGRAKIAMRADEMNGLCIPSVELSDYVLQLNEKMKDKDKDDGIFINFAHDPKQTDLQILRIHDGVFNKMTKLQKKDNAGNAIQTSMASIRMVKCIEIQKRSRDFIEFSISHNVCPNLCCLFDDTDFCANCTSYKLVANSAEFSYDE